MMIKDYTLLIALIILILPKGIAHDSYKRNESADVRQYVFNLTLNDDTDEIKGETFVTVDFTAETKMFALDLIGKTDTFGMNVTGVYADDALVDYTFSDDKIFFNTTGEGPGVRTYKILYQGIPEKGLVIDTTKYGQRSFFGDNWPNLARNWLPCVDHPYDKASVEFGVTAPEHYDVVATGRKIEESNLGNGLKLTRYYEPAPVAMKVVTIGVTRFATKYLGSVQDIPITAWVYPENRLDGFSDYAVAVDVLDYFVKNVGPYSYAKLANMQAKTQWGGLENAGTIAYAEKSVTGENKVERLFAHEIAHQWFGNAVTEDSWNHVWLSESFATYFAMLYQEEVHGNKKRKEELKTDRMQVIEYFQEKQHPVVDLTIRDPKEVLSTNTYQKGSWVLNMLRHKLGDETFWKGIRAYYQAYQNANVLTDDFQRAMEQASGLDLTDFFDQWLFVTGHPVLEWDWQYKKDRVKISVEQTQMQHTFQFPLDIGVYRKGKMELKTVMVDEKSETFEFTVDAQPDSIVLDPEMWLLFEEKE